jgi:hypothetical protein
MKILRIKQKLSHEEIERLRHTMLDERHYDFTLDRAPVTILDAETEQFVLLYLPAGLSRGVSEMAYWHLRNRGHNTMNSHRLALRGMPGKEAVYGYLDQHGRCTLTASTLKYLDHFVAALPLPWECDSILKTYRPREYAQLLASADPRYLLPRPGGGYSVLSSLTVNYCVPTRAHTDPRNSRLSVLSVSRAGRYQGGDLVSVPYRFAVPLYSQDVVVMCGAIMHGSTAQRGKPGTYERLVHVLYTRQKMVAQTAGRGE